MNLEIKTTKQVAIIVSVISSILDTIVAILHGTPWWAWPLTAVCTYFITYYLFRFLLHKYVIFRIKPLYQLLLSKDIIASRLSEELRRKVDDDVVDDIQENLNHLIAFSGTELERLEQQEKQRIEFLISLYHEIKTPVSIIQGYAHTLFYGGLKDQEIIRKYQERTINAVDRLAGIIKDTETIAYYESGKTVIDKTYFDIDDLCREIVEENMEMASELKVELKIEKLPSSGAIIVYADKAKIGLVLNNIIVNSIKYSNPQNSVVVGFVDMFDKILVEITDSGAGIPPEDLPHVFETFYRVDKSRTRETGGSGLGLSIVKRIIDAHGEYITIRSEVSVGTTFSFTLTKSKPQLHAG